MNKIVLDASAVLALINKEPGHIAVEKILTHSVISAVNLSEVIAVLVDIGMDVKDVETIVYGIINDIVPFDHKQSVVAGALRKETKQLGLSLGDRACLALAKVLRVPVLTADKIWSKVNVGIEVKLIR
jgi:PIN domain nuclease of toxin-antitoxin system